MGEDPIVGMSAPGPEQLAGPGMAANNAQMAQQAQAQALIRKLLLQRAMQAQGGIPSGGYQPPPMLGAPPARPMAPQAMPGRPPFGGGSY